MDIQAIILNFENAPDAKTRETLCTLRRRGYKLAANCACGACDVFFEGGGRESLLAAAKALGVAPEECAAVESDCESLIAAKNCGMTAIGVENAQNCIYADICISDFSLLSDIFA
ncbi:MAG: hypothetical protein IJW21_06395 [Clostridia bacterium]|nr:hypothetical protein [Clostridia bacterium]